MLFLNEESLRMVSDLFCFGDAKEKPKDFMQRFGRFSVKESCLSSI
jgi:hypothetical protein